MRTHLSYAAFSTTLIAVIALLIASAALAGNWGQTYVDQTSLYSNVCCYSSDYNGEVGYNAASWDSAGAELSLCNTGGSCYGFATDYSGYFYDSRNISYGAAVCAMIGGEGWIYVNYCYANNF